MSARTRPNAHRGFAVVRRAFGVSACAALVVGVTIVSACSRTPAAEDSVRVECTIQPAPPSVGPATVDLVLADRTGAPVKGASVRVEGNMNHAGMVPSIGIARELEPGHYQADLEFTMGGDWFLLVQTTLADGSKSEHTIPVPAVRRQ